MKEAWHRAADASPDAGSSASPGRSGHDHDHDHDHGDGEEGGKGSGKSEGEDDEGLIRRAGDVAFRIATRVITDWPEVEQVSEVKVLARGGYHHVWRVTYTVVRLFDSPFIHLPLTSSQASTMAAADVCKEKHVVLRVQREAAACLQPYKLRHEVACLQYLAKNLPAVPAPRVYAWDDGTSRIDPPFIVEEYIPGQRLSVAWPLLTEAEKTSIVREIAGVTAALGETRFRAIGGFTSDLQPGPTIEAAKLFNGRVRASALATPLIKLSGSV